MDRLWHIVEKEHIKVIYKEMSHIPEKLHGLYMYDKRFGSIIVLGNHLLCYYRLHKCVLGEEIGHFYTSPRTNILTAYASASLKVIMTQDERKALEYATDLLIPSDEFDRAVSEGCQSIYDLAEWFDVTEWFVYRKLEILKTKHREMGIKMKSGDYFKVKLV